MSFWQTSGRSRLKARQQQLHQQHGASAFASSGTTAFRSRNQHPYRRNSTVDPTMAPPRRQSQQPRRGGRSRGLSSGYPPHVDPITRRAIASAPTPEEIAHANSLAAATSIAATSSAHYPYHAESQTERTTRIRDAMRARYNLKLGGQLVAPPAPPLRYWQPPPGHTNNFVPVASSQDATSAGVHENPAMAQPPPQPIVVIPWSAGRPLPPNAALFYAPTASSDSTEMSQPQPSLPYQAPPPPHHPQHEEPPRKSFESQWGTAQTVPQRPSLFPRGFGGGGSSKTNSSTHNYSNAHPLFANHHVQPSFLSSSAAAETEEYFFDLPGETTTSSSSTPWTGGDSGGWPVQQEEPPVLRFAAFRFRRQQQQQQQQSYVYDTSMWSPSHTRPLLPINSTDSFLDDTESMSEPVEFTAWTNNDGASSHYGPTPHDPPIRDNVHHTSDSSWTDPWVDNHSPPSSVIPQRYDPPQQRPPPLSMTGETTQGGGLERFRTRLVQNAPPHPTASAVDTTGGTVQGGGLERFRSRPVAKADLSSSLLELVSSEGNVLQDRSNTVHGPSQASTPLADDFPPPQNLTPLSSSKNPTAQSSSPSNNVQPNPHPSAQESLPLENDDNGADAATVAAQEVVLVVLERKMASEKKSAAEPPNPNLPLHSGNRRNKIHNRHPTNHKPTTDPNFPTPIAFYNNSVRVDLAGKPLVSSSNDHGKTGATSLETVSSGSPNNDDASSTNLDMQGRTSLWG